jgi:hypothetical protein
MYFDLESETVKTAQHVVFDETMVDHPSPPPNARLLALSSPSDPVPVTISDAVQFPELDFSFSPFTNTSLMLIDMDYGSDFPFGFSVATCSILKRAFISELHRSPVPRLSLRSFRSKYLGAYVVSLHETQIFSPSDVDSVLSSLRELAHPPPQIQLILAPERRTAITGANSQAPLHLRRVDLQRITTLCPPNSPSLLVSRLVTTPMTDAERALPKLTRHRLKKLDNWPDWDAAFDKQLDAHHRDGALGKPVLIADLIKKYGHRPRLLRFHWTNVVKNDGTRKSRACIDGSKRAAPWLRDDVPTYASCVEQPAMKLFYALCAIYLLIVTVGDSDNAYQQSPPPRKKCYMALDEAFISWFLKRFGLLLDPNLWAIPVERAIQGHPEAGRLWQDHIVSFITGPELRFTSTGHERNLYRGIFLGEVVLICRQVDDFAIGTSTPAVAEQLIAKINSFARTTSNGIGVPTSFGISIRYNGLDVHQTRHYIKLSCETYINRLLSTHGWETPSPNSSDRPDLVPLHPDVAARVALLVGPAEGTPEHHDLAQKVGFSYRQLLGELIYAYVIIRIDIGFAVCFLARYSAAPHHEHYLALKNIARYLRTTIHWGIHYWRPAPVTALPDIPFELATVDPDLPPFPETTLHELVGFVDASHAACLLTRRSVTGYAFCLAGAVVAYKSKLQPVVATSSTEAEFYAAVIAGKLAKYLCSILTDLLFPP